MTYAFQSLKHFRCDKQNPLNQLFAIFALFFVLLSAIKCWKIFSDKRKSDMKSNSIKFELRFIDIGNINLTICKIFEIFRADSSHRFSIFIDHFTEKSFLNFVKNLSIFWTKLLSPVQIIRFVQLWLHAGKVLKSAPVVQIQCAFAATEYQNRKTG